MKKHKINTHISIDQLRQYVAGKASFAQQHEVEKAALEDAFVADALEGLTAMNEDKINSRTTADDLQQQLREKIQLKQQKQIPIWYYATAAMILIGIGLVWLWQRYSLEKATQDIVATTKPIEKKSTVSVIDSTKLMVMATPPPSKPQPAPTIEEIKAEDRIAAKTTEGDPNAEEAIIAPEEQILPKEEVMSVTPISGKKDTNAIAYQDDNLSIKSKLKRSMPAAFLKNEDTYYKNTILAPRITSPIPLVGSEQYIAYLDSATAIYKQQNQIVTNVYCLVSFTVDENGKPINFLFENQIDTNIQDEAIRIIEHGSLWKIQDKKDTQVKLILKF